MRRVPADLPHPSPAERDSKGYAQQPNPAERRLGHMLRTQCDPAERETKGHPQGSPLGDEGHRKGVKGEFLGL